MSLLLEALKQAEAAKRAKQSDPQSPTDAHNGSTAPTSRTVSVSLSLSNDDAPLSSAPTPTPTTPSTSSNLSLSIADDLTPLSAAPSSPTPTPIHTTPPPAFLRASTPPTPNPPPTPPTSQPRPAPTVPAPTISAPPPTQNHDDSSRFFAQRQPSSPSPTPSSKMGQDFAALTAKAADLFHSKKTTEQDSETTGGFFSNRSSNSELDDDVGGFFATPTPKKPTAPPKPTQTPTPSTVSARAASGAPPYTSTAPVKPTPFPIHLETRQPTPIPIPVAPPPATQTYAPSVPVSAFVESTTPPPSTALQKARRVLQASQQPVKKRRKVSPIIAGGSVIIVLLLAVILGFFWTLWDEEIEPITRATPHTLAQQKAPTNLNTAEEEPTVTIADPAADDLLAQLAAQSFTLPAEASMPNLPLPEPPTPTPLPTAVPPPPSTHDLPAQPKPTPPRPKKPIFQVKTAPDGSRLFTTDAPAFHSPRTREAYPSRATVTTPLSTASSPNALLTEHAWEAWQQGNLSAAADAYRQAIAQSPDDMQARLGLAATLAWQGQNAEAMREYREVLNTSAREAVSNPSEHTAHVQAQAQAAFQLGNQFAQQSKWELAQQHYFQAHSQAPQNPDFAFNLAVSLEHLGLSEQARNYYAHALQLAQHQPSQFAHQTAQQRIEQLSPESPPPDNPPSSARSAQNDELGDAQNPVQEHLHK